jgi:hypothetical protein
MVVMQFQKFVCFSNLWSLNQLPFGTRRKANCLLINPTASQSQCMMSQVCTEKCAVSLCSQYPVPEEKILLEYYLCILIICREKVCNYWTRLININNLINKYFTSCLASNCTQVKRFVTQLRPWVFTKENKTRDTAVPAGTQQNSYWAQSSSSKF